MAGELWVEEFVWRGRPPGSAQPSGWHVVIGMISQDNGKPLYSDPLTPAQAEQAGFSLAEIIKGLNTDAMQERDALRVERDALVTEIAANNLAAMG